MKPSFSGLLVAGVGGLAIAFIAVGAPASRRPPAAISATAEAPPGSISFAGFTLASPNVVLPTDDAIFPEGPHADVVNANCISCHSASMALTQPALSADQWKATVTKMRTVYHAPIVEEDIPAIIAYLAAMPGQGATPAAAAKASVPVPDGARTVPAGNR